MRISFSRGIGRRMVAYALAGTMVTCSVATKDGTLTTEGNKNSINYDLVNGFYYDEDVKKNREDLMNRIKFGGSDKVKTYGKKLDTVSTAKKIYK